MSHPKIAQTITFTDKYTSQLGLSQSQVKAIDELDYKFLKEYTFSLKKDYSDRKEKRKYFKSLFLLLNEKQKKDYKEIRRQSRERRTKNDKKFEEEQFGRDLKKYETLELSHTNFLKFREILGGIMKSVHEVSIENINQNLPQINRQERLIELARKRFEGFLNERQIKEFLRIKAREHDIHVISRIEMIQYQYEPLKLTNEQARKIHQYEENDPTYDENAEYLSEFEKWDIEKDFMKSILDKEQFSKYLELKEKNELLYIEGLKETNQRRSKEVIRYTNRKEYLIKNFMPVKCKWRTKIQKFIDYQLEEEIESIRVTYTKDLISNLERNLKASLRYYQNYVPNELAVIQLKSQLDILWPNLFSLNERHRHLINSLPQDLVDQLSKEDPKVAKAGRKLHEFTIKNYEDTGGTYGGIHVIRKSVKDDRKITMLSNLLLKPTVHENLEMMNRIIKKFD